MNFHAIAVSPPGPLKSASIDVTSPDWRLQMTGDIGGWGLHAGIQEARFTLRHSVHGENSPSLQVLCYAYKRKKSHICSLVSHNLSTV